jgi:hypothetical protein
MGVMGGGFRLLTGRRTGWRSRYFRENMAKLFAGDTPKNPGRPPIQRERCQREPIDRRVGIVFVYWLVLPFLG